MWSAGFKSELYLGERAAAARLQDGRRLSVTADGWSASLDALRLQMPAARRRGRLRIWLSGGLVRPFVLQPMAGIENRQEAIQAAESMAPDLTGLAGPCSVWLSDREPSISSLGAAIETSVLDTLRNWSADQGFRLRSVRPWWNLALTQSMNPSETPPLLALEDDDALTVLSQADGKAPVAFTCSPVPEIGERTNLLKRTALANDRRTEDLVQARWLMNIAPDQPRQAPLGQIERIALPA